MNYQQNPQVSSYPYPAHNIDPAAKDDNWCMQYARAAYHDFLGLPKGVFWANNGDYVKFRQYAMGKQPITVYKNLLGITDDKQDTWLSVDWSVRPIVSRYRDRAISRLMKQQKGIVATPIDELAKAEMEQWYAQMKAKLVLRDAMQQSGNTDMANHPMLMPQTGEPMDLEELEMRVELGEQFNRAKDAEEAIELAFYENGYNKFVRGLYEDLFDYGVAGYKEWLGDDNHAKFRKVKPESVIVSTCSQADFSDAVHAGEVTDVALIDLAAKTDKDGNKLFSDKELEDFAGTLVNKWGNPNNVGNKPYNKFKCKVLDLEFFSYNEYVYRTAPDSVGNADFRKADYKRGKQSDKYTRKCFKVVYKCKWVVGTEKVYDCGLAEDMKRSPIPQEMADTQLSYRFFAYNFNEMTAQGMMERLIPYLDDYQLTVLKVQNFKNRAVPSGWWIDFDALENVAVNKAGKNMTPKEILQMFFETGVLGGRSVKPDGTPQSPNWKPIIPIENTAASELAMLYQDMVNTIGQIEATTGWNSATMGEANPKTLVPGYELANQSTDDALFPLAFAESCLKEKLAEDVLCRMAQGIKKGEVSGFAPYVGALNKNTLTLIKVSPDLPLRKYGIILEERSTDQEKMQLLQLMQQDIANGFLDTSDVALVIHTHNVKEAYLILSLRVKKAKEAMNKQKLAEIQQQNQGQQQAAQIAQQGAMQQFQMQSQVDMQKLQATLQAQLQMKQMELETQFKIMQLKMGATAQMTTETNATKSDVANVTAQAKVISQQIAHETTITAQHLDNMGDLEKQKEANKKPKTTSK